MTKDIDLEYDVYLKKYDYKKSKRAQFKTLIMLCLAIYSLNINLLFICKPIGYTSNLEFIFNNFGANIAGINIFCILLTAIVLIVLWVKLLSTGGLYPLPDPKSKRCFICELKPLVHKLEFMNYQMEIWIGLAMSLMTSSLIMLLLILIYSLNIINIDFISSLIIFIIPLIPIIIIASYAIGIIYIEIRWRSNTK